MLTTPAAATARMIADIFALFIGGSRFVAATVSRLGTRQQRAERHI
jgi:hypothetical protein